MDNIVIPPISWDELASVADTGDVIIFSGTSEISEAIEVGTSGEYSHSGMVYKDIDGKLYFWQTGPDPVVFDWASKSFHGGAQLGGLTNVLSVLNVGGDSPFYRQLQWERTTEFRTAIDAFIQKMDGTPFGTVEDLVKNWLKARAGSKVVPPNQVFCAELLAMTYNAGGLLDLTEHPPTWYSPTSWSAAANEVKLLHGSLTVEAPIDLTNMPVPVEPLRPGTNPR